MTVRLLKHPAAILGLVLGAVTIIGAAELQSGPQFASVDILKVVYESKQGKESNAKFEQMKGELSKMLQQWGEAPILNNDDFAELRKAFDMNATPEQRAKATALLATGQKNVRRLTDLQAKKDLTEVEKAEMTVLTSQLTTTRDGLLQIQQDLNQRLQDWAGDAQKRILAQTKDTVSQLSKQRGYTVVFDSSAAPYSANDITDAVLAEMNKK